MMRSSSLAPLALVLFGLVLAAGCGGEDASREQAGRSSATTETEAQTEAEAPGPVAEDATYELRATASGPYAAGQPGSFEIRLTGRGDYHVNTDPRFPFSIALSGPDAVQFGEASLDREDAAAFTEEEARFEVPFTPQAAGEHRVTAVVDFAVCTPSNCMPDQRTLALVVPVQ